LENEFPEFKKYVQTDQSASLLIAQIEDSGPFEKCRKHFGSSPSFQKVHKFMGGLATVFPGTATLEADFSEVKWTKDEYSVGLQDFSLEAKLHAKQHEDILKVQSKVKDYLRKQAASSS
jgi:hypothetical protein